MIGVFAFCFPAGTPVTVKQNNHKALKNIENIVAGDEVGGYDHTLKKFAWGVVKATKKSIKRGLVAMYAAGMLIAQPTLEHPVWTENHHDYITAQNLTTGDILLDGKGATLRLDSLVVKPDTTLTVYNFEVENLHNYYVGTQEVLVHNTCATLESLEMALDAANIPNAQKKIKDFEKAFAYSGITRAERTNFYTQILADLNGSKLTIADVDNLLSQFNSGSITKEIKQYLAKNVSKGSLDAWVAIKTWTHKSDVYDLLRSKNLNLYGNSYSVKKVGNDLEVYHQDGRKIATISKTEITASSTSGSGGETASAKEMNQLLNVYPHLKKYTYKIDDGRFEYITDDKGRVKSFTDTDYRLVGGKPRSYAEQSDAKVIKNGKVGTTPVRSDDGGHMGSKESGGPCEQINYYPMDYNSNQNGAWRQMEEFMIRLRDNPANAGKKIQYTVIPTFSQTRPGRPDSFEVIYQVGNNAPVTYPNPILNPY